MYLGAGNPCVTHVSIVDLLTSRCLARISRLTYFGSSLMVRLQWGGRGALELGKLGSYSRRRGLPLQRGQLLQRVLKRDVVVEVIRRAAIVSGLLERLAGNDRLEFRRAHDGVAQPLAERFKDLGAKECRL